MRSSAPYGLYVLIRFDLASQSQNMGVQDCPAISRVQGDKLKASREIRIAAMFRDAPAEFLKMIVVHELAHLN